MNTTSSIRAPRSSLSFGVKSGCEEEIARRESPLLKLLLIEKHDSQIWYWRKESNLHHALIWGLRLIRPLHYHCATPAWRFGVKGEGGRMKPAVASASFHPSSLILHPLVWSGRRDSNSRSEFGRLTCFQLHHFRVVIADCQLPISDWRSFFAESLCRNRNRLNWEQRTNRQSAI